MMASRKQPGFGTQDNVLFIDIAGDIGSATFHEVYFVHKNVVVSMVPENTAFAEKILIFSDSPGTILTFNRVIRLCVVNIIVYFLTTLDSERITRSRDERGILLLIDPIIRKR